MYKAKVKFWIFLVLLSILISNFSEVFSFAKGLFIKQEYSVFLDIDNPAMFPKFDSFNKKGVVLNTTSNKTTADIIVADSSDAQIEGYTKYEDQFTSPILMYVPTKAYNASKSGFTKYSHDEGMNTYYYMQNDLKVFLEAVEDGKTYTEIGIIKDVFGDGPVTIAIPKDDGLYYDEIRLLMALTLNNYSYDGVYNDALQLRVDAIIDKCVRYDDAVTYIGNIDKDIKNREKTIVLAPECIIAQSYRVNSASDNSYYISCLPLKTINISFDMYLRNTDNENYYDKLFKALTHKKFLELTGLRNKEVSYKIYKVSSFSYNINSVSLIYE